MQIQQIGIVGLLFLYFLLLTADCPAEQIMESVTFL